jgi:hypothetical protein
MTTREPKISELTKKYRTRDMMQCTAKIEINCIGLTLRVDQRSGEIRINNQIPLGRFIFIETMLARINLYFKY